MEKIEIKELGPDQPDIKITQQASERGSATSYTRGYNRKAAAGVAEGRPVCPDPGRPGGDRPAAPAEGQEPRTTGAGRHGHTHTHMSLVTLLITP